MQICIGPLWWRRSSVKRWSSEICHDWKSKISDASNWNEFLPQGVQDDLIEIWWGALSPRSSQMRWLRRLYQMSDLRICPTKRRPGGRPRTCWILLLSWPGNTFLKSWSKCLWRGKSGHHCLSCCPHNLAQDKRWMDVFGGQDLCLKDAFIVCFWCQKKHCFDKKSKGQVPDWSTTVSQASQSIRQAPSFLS